MSVNLDTVRSLDAYTRWADAKLLGALSDEVWLKEVGGSFGSIRNTAVHLVSAQAVWLSRWLGRPLQAHWAPEELAGPAALLARWEELARARAAFLDGQSDATLAAELRYALFDGRPDAHPLGELFLHMANHSTYHRGQLAAFLRNAGVKPPSTDYVAWIRSGKS